jgi:hypothetical protein
VGLRRGRWERIEVARSKIRNAMNLVAQENEQTEVVEMVRTANCKKEGEGEGEAPSLMSQEDMEA